MKALLIGFGNVGQKIAEVLTEKRKYPGLSSLDLSFTGIFTKTRGYLIDPSGIIISEALHAIREEGCLSHSNQPIVKIPLLEAVQKLDYDLLLELSTLSITNKGEPAISYIREALKRGKHVVTANKGPMAFAYDELLGIARKNDVHFRFESTVMDGTPIFNLAEKGLKGATITRLTGILNSTTNYIISQMEQGSTFQEALEHAQKEGFAEADPKHDIDGWDSAAKISVLANVLMNAHITPDSVDREGISDITPNRIQQAIKNNRRIRLICKAWREKQQLHTKVCPEEIPVQDPFATVQDTGACLKIETDTMNPLLIFQQSPTLWDTTYGVLNDILIIYSSETKKVKS